ncbi:MAG: short-chain dehydrogenase [Ignavibacteria bacterium GWF2_33_9]|nr:MAG: short-chain dehydrogenase [Ignavibacteria bacterium GWF2_33_9]
MEKNKTCLILGATSGIAEAIAIEFAKNNFDLILTGRNSDELNKIEQDFKIRYNANCSAHHLEITDLESHRTFLENLQILPDVIVFAIGYLGEQKSSEAHYDEARKVIDINFTYPMNLLNHFANEFEKRKSGTIIGISSVAGDRGRKANYIYGSAKAALSAYLSGLRNRLSGSHVEVITIKPGFVRTKMTEHLETPGRFTTEPQEVAKDTWKGFAKKKDVIYSKKIYRYLLFVIKHIPEKIFKKLSI